MQLVAMVVTVGVVCSFEIDGLVCVPPVQGILVFWNLNLPQTARMKG